MVEYKDRLAAAMRKLGRDPEAAADVRWLAGRLGVSYQAVVKVLKGKSKFLSATNNAEAAKALECDASWLAGSTDARAATGHHVGEPTAHYDATLPLRDGEDALLVVWRLASPETRAEVIAALEQSALTTNELLMRSLEKLKVTKRADDTRVWQALPPAPSANQGAVAADKDRARNR